LFREEVYAIVKRIPRGKVATYGQIAALTGDRLRARAVGNTLHRNTEQFAVPCYRVVNARGELSAAYGFGGREEQALLLRLDGIEVENGAVDLERYGWNPNECE